MYIHEAVNIAIQEDKVICRKSVERCTPETQNIVIFPTSSYVTCCVAKVKENVVVDILYNWNPTANDLIADDWQVEERPLIKRP